MEQSSSSFSRVMGKRDPSQSLLNKRDVATLLERIRSNDSTTHVLKIKDHVLSDITPSILNTIFEALEENTVCQALYVQNLNTAFFDEQLQLLLKLLKKKLIWALNIGENYNISSEMWDRFCVELEETNVTHLYVSEHVITVKMKTRMRDAIRSNRKKHNKHRSKRNIKVIEKCTNLWWNPINSIKHRETRDAEALHRKRQRDGSTNPNLTIYWADREGCQDEWKFSCKCGEVCSSYEKHIFHPTGLQFQCGLCQVWGHVHCNFGKITADELNKMDETLCHKCMAARRRYKKNCVTSGIEYDEHEFIKFLARSANPTQHRWMTNIDNNIEEPSVGEVEEDWIQCDKCKKWRLLPNKDHSKYPKELPDIWTCKMARWIKNPSCRKKEDDYSMTRVIDAGSDNS